jgi:hypothetical protein
MAESGSPLGRLRPGPPAERAYRRTVHIRQNSRSNFILHASARARARAIPDGKCAVECHVVLVSDEAINRAQLALWETLRVVAEPGGAAAFAALISGSYEPRPGEHVGILLSGGNTTAVNFGS